ncbi:MULTISPECIES: Crp/Fnr family transcriptional regulator [Flavobacteriaceae]|uniref:Crp/Fnr family transcriptional regulator n=1 Tax=Flavobacteriaceae TaxID=49546 RepID=UPI0014926BDE|nr:MULTISPECIES: Crp/Fnr family transcriptional regulator [Allomuricauda]MDC6365724.1 Crp/Fnr family transcriptional regulator [Muricauda sp. AC10]
MDERIQVLIKHLSRYIQLNEKDVESISRHTIIKEYGKGDFLVESGKVCQYENYILEGCTYTYLLDADGKTHVLRFAIEDWWATDLGSFINQEPANFNVKCLKKTVVIQFSYDALEQLYALVPPLERFFRIATQKAFAHGQKRVAQNLSLQARDRYQLFLKQYPKIGQTVPDYLIASYLGVTKQFLSKIRSEG